MQKFLMLMIRNICPSKMNQITSDENFSIRNYNNLHGMCIIQKIAETFLSL